MNSRRIALALLLGAMLAVPALGQSADAPNFLRNPGAEEEPPPPPPLEEDQPPPPQRPPGWAVEAEFTVGEYGAPGFPGRDVGAQIDGGRRFFVGGTAPAPGFGQSSASQTVDVSSDAGAIDRGDVRAELAAAIGGLEGEEDTGTVRAQFRDAAGRPLGDALSLGPVTGSDRGGQTKFLPRSTSAAVPPGTRRIDVVMTARSVTGDYIDAYFDNVRLHLPGATHLVAPDTGVGGGGTADGPGDPRAPGSDSGDGSRADAVLRLSRRPVRLSQSGVIRVRANCARRDSPCRGRISATAARRRCGQRRAFVPARRSRRVTLRLGRRCRALVVRRARGLRLHVSFAMTGGGTVTVPLVVRPAIRTRARRR